MKKIYYKIYYKPRGFFFMFMKWVMYDDIHYEQKIWAEQAKTKLEIQLGDILKFKIEKEIS